MLFNNVPSDKIRDHLISLLETAIFCMRVIEVAKIPDDVRMNSIHSALYDALVPVINDNIANNFEYGYMLDKVGRKINPLILED